MVNAPLTGLETDPERALAMTYAAPAHRPALAALWRLDDRLADILRTTREPMVGQMRLTWWHAALAALDESPPPAEPVLQALADEVLALVSGGRLAAWVEGWEALLEPTLDDAAMRSFATHRGGGVFTAMASVAGVNDPAVALAGEGWALVDLARHLQAPDAAARARHMAAERLAATAAFRWPAPARMLGAVAQSARLDLVSQPRRRGHPARATRLLWHRVSGR